MKTEIKLFCSSNVASVFLKPIILHGIYALNLEKRREKLLVILRRGEWGVILNCVVKGGDFGGFPLPPAEDQRGIHIIL